MEANVQQNPTIVSKILLPPIADLFKQSIDLFVFHIKRLLTLWFISMLAYSITFIALLLIIGATALIGVASPGFSEETFNAALVNLMQPQYIVMLLAGLFLFIAAMTYIGIMYSASMILLLSDEQRAHSPWSLFKQGSRYVWKLFVAGLLVGILSIGGLFFFFIPYVIFVTVFSFYMYVVVLEGKTGMAALKASAMIVLQNFWAILFRFSILWLSFIAISIALGSLFPASEDSESIINIVQFFLNTLLNIYILCYTYILYRHAKQAAVDKPVQLAWMWIIAGLGWIMAFAVVMISINYGARYVNDILQNLDTEMMEEQIIETQPLPVTEDELFESDFAPVPIELPENSI